MAIQRTVQVEHIRDAVGSDIMDIDELNDAWPSIVSVVTTNGMSKIALHVSGIGPHHRPGGVSPHERRFIWSMRDGKGAPVSAPNGSFPLVLGISKEPGEIVLVAKGGVEYLGIEKRLTVLFTLGLLEEAAAFKWAVYENTKGEKIFAFKPRLLPILIESLVSGAELPADEIARSGVQSGLLVENPPLIQERVRTTKQVQKLFRSAKFGGDVKSAYSEKCAMCDLGMQVVVGAHILPVSAPNSPDVVSNGLALCENHHAAYDRHLIEVLPDDLSIVIRPDIVQQAAIEPALRRFLDGTRPQLRSPDSGDAPNPEMIRARHAFAGSKVHWIK